MSYDHRLLFAQIVTRLGERPSRSLAELSHALRVSSRTIQKVIAETTHGGFKELQRELLMSRINRALVSQPGLAIKELSFAIGYESPRSFARAIKRAWGMSPRQLRSRIVEGICASSGVLHS